MFFSNTIKNFLKTAIIPLGHTMYVYGGGWDETDTVASKEAASMGESQGWRDFFLTQNENYDYKNFLHCSPLGLDCTGYIGWIIYNTFYHENNKPGFVFESSVLGEKLRDAGLGCITKSTFVTNHLPGDIFYSSVYHHAYISLGEFSDKSIMLLHSSPPGVMVSGTASPLCSTKSQAQKVATAFMEDYCPYWFQKYPNSDRPLTYLNSYDKFRFYRVVLTDPEGVTKLKGRELLNSLL